MNGAQWITVTVPDHNDYIIDEWCTVDNCDYT